MRACRAANSCAPLAIGSSSFSICGSSRSAVIICFTPLKHSTTFKCRCSTKMKLHKHPVKGVVSMKEIQRGSLFTDNRVMTTNGIIEGTSEPDSGLRSFKGIPFAAPPVGELRWKPPQPVANWSGVRKADQFAPRAMQLPLFGDMSFRSRRISEDCLYLNVLTPATSDQDHLPVLVYFYGGGLLTGDGSEPRYDGASLARKGIVVLTVNYRLNVFGFFAHSGLTQEAPHHASGNYGHLDQ